MLFRNAITDSRRYTWRKPSSDFFKWSNCQIFNNGRNNPIASTLGWPGQEEDLFAWSSDGNRSQTSTLDDSCTCCISSQRMELWPQLFSRICYWYWKIINGGHGQRICFDYCRRLQLISRTRRSRSNYGRILRAILNEYSKWSRFSRSMDVQIMYWRILSLGLYFAYKEFTIIWCFRKLWFGSWIRSSQRIGIVGIYPISRILEEASDFIQRMEPEIECISGTTGVSSVSTAKDWRIYAINSSRTRTSRYTSSWSRRKFFQRTKGGETTAPIKGTKRFDAHETRNKRWLLKKKYKQENSQIGTKRTSTLESYVGWTFTTKIRKYKVPPEDK